MSSSSSSSAPSFFFFSGEENITWDSDRQIPTTTNRPKYSEEWKDRVDQHDPSTGSEGREERRKPECVGATTQSGEHGRATKDAESKGGRHLQPAGVFGEFGPPKFIGNGGRSFPSDLA